MQFAKSPKTPHPDDITVGANIRRLRQLRGMAQEVLGAQLNITFQQIQKYEKGTNRVSASRLVAIARVLGCSLDDLFGGTDLDTTESLHLPAMSRQALRLAMAFDTIDDDRQRRHILGLVEALSTATDGTSVSQLVIAPDDLPFIAAQ